MVWLRKLRDRTARGIILDRIARLARGLPGDVAPVGGMVSELRIHYGPGYRVYFTERQQTLIIVLCGGNKASQQRDIRQARQLAAGL